jgi:hypothetical protein
VLEGSVRRSGDRLRITAQLIDGENEAHLWAERYDVFVQDVFDVQDDITRAVAGALAVHIDDAHLSRARRRDVADLELYDCWLRGLECLRHGTPRSDEQARAYFVRALEIDPHFARGHAGISLSHFNDWSCQAWDRWDERERGAFEHARRAVELDDADHVTHCILGRIHAYRREFSLAEKHFDRSLALNPNDAEILMHIVLGLTQLGRHDEASALADTALRLNPRHGDWYYGAAAMPLYLEGEFEAALAHAERGPDTFVDARAFMAGAYARLGRDRQSRDCLERFLSTFREKITFGRDPEPGEPIRWILHVNPFRHERDTEHVRTTLTAAGLSVS